MKIERSVYLGIPAAVLAGLILFTYFSYRGDIVAAEARAASGGRVVDTPCGPIEYALAGKGAPVLLVHGAGGGFDQGLEFGRPLAERGFTVIAVTRFGYLRTPMPADAAPTAASVKPMMIFFLRVMTERGSRRRRCGATESTSILIGMNWDRIYRRCSIQGRISRPFR